MYHSINIITNMRNYIGANGLGTVKPINTWDDWHLVPSSRPTISNPKLITKYIDIPGASGSVDLTDALTGFPTYSDREGEIEFYVMNDYGIWTQRRNEINNILHGQKVSLYLDDELDYYYVGRIEVDDWKSQKDFSTITLKYRLEPYKYSIRDVGEPWIWDPFNFENGIINDIYQEMTGDTDTSKYKEYIFRGENLPMQPTYGIFNVSDLQDNDTIKVKFINNELNISTETILSNGSNIMYDFLFSNLSGQNNVIMRVKGNGKINISMHFRSL